MRFWAFTRGPASARLLVDFGEEHGLPPAKLLAGTRLSLAQLADPNAEVTGAQELRIVSNLVRLLKRPAGLGFQVGSRYHFSAYGVWGYDLVSSATAGDAIALALRFLPLSYAFTVIAYHEGGRLGVLSFGEPDLPDDVKRFVVERDMAAAAVLQREILGEDFALRRVTLRAARPASADGAHAAARDAFGVEPEYAARSNTLAFDRAVLRRPLPQANPITVAMCEQMCSRLMEERRARLGTATMIRHYLSATPGSTLPTLGDMARLMNASERTLKRRLHDEGTTFRALLAESRGAMAEHLLARGDLTLTEIAERLGFSDLSSFSQAFKRWFGVAPSAHRKGAR